MVVGIVLISAMQLHIYDEPTSPCSPHCNSSLLSSSCSSVVHPNWITSLNTLLGNIQVCGSSLSCILLLLFTTLMLLKVESLRPCFCQLEEQYNHPDCYFLGWRSTISFWLAQNGFMFIGFRQIV